MSSIPDTLESSIQSIRGVFLDHMVYETDLQQGQPTLDILETKRLHGVASHANTVHNTHVTSCLSYDNDKMK